MIEDTPKTVLAAHCHANYTELGLKKWTQKHIKEVHTTFMSNHVRLYRA